MRIYQLFIIVIVLASLLQSCKKDDAEEENGETPTTTGKIRFEFYHNVDGSPLQVDTLLYTNAAGNQYLVNEIQYFISDMTLHSASCECSDYLIDEWKDIHYVDTDIPETQSWDVFDDIPAGNYDEICFTFGINEQKNQSLMFVNPPESFMFWPEYLGGGYHYMKLNGKWLDSLNNRMPFNFHLGIGQIYDSTGNITGFIQNYFTVTLPQSSIKIEAGKTKTVQITMNIENWFKDPHLYDHNDWGGDIMQKQSAMKMACDNGQNVFDVLINN